MPVIRANEKQIEWEYLLDCCTGGMKYQSVVVDHLVYTVSGHTSVKSTIRKMPGYKWVPYTGMRATIPGMICAGRDLDGSNIVVGRANHNGDVLPAKAKPEHAIAYVAYGGAEHEKRQFEIMMPADFHWVRSQNGNVPFGAIEAGTTSNGEVLYVGRGYQQGVPVVGKVQRSHNCLYVPWNGQEISLRDYEVLVQM